MSIKRKLVPNGQSVAMTLPKVITDLHGMKKGTVVEIEDAGTGLLIKYPEKVSD